MFCSQANTQREMGENIPTLHTYIGAMIFSGSSWEHMSEHSCSQCLEPKFYQLTTERNLYFIIIINV